MEVSNSSISLGKETHTIMPLSVHVFEHNGVHYVFDIRNYAILEFPAEGSEVLMRMSEKTLEEIIVDLRASHTQDSVRAWYLRVLEMARDGLFSLTPLARPARPHFERLVVMLAGGCNMGCEYCFERDVPIYQNKNLMSLRQADEVVSWFTRAQSGDKAHVQFYGGEPLLNFDVLKHMLNKLERWAIAEGVDLSKYLITNGTLLNDEIIEYLVAHGVSIQVSVDGDEKVHDKLRVFKSGAPTMKHIFPNIIKLREVGADFNLRAVLTSKAPDPCSVTDGLFSLGAGKVSFEVVASGNKAIDLSDDDWKQFNARYAKWVNAPYRTWAGLPHEIQNTIIRICEKKHVFYGCGAGVSEVTVAPNGDIYECQRLLGKPYARIDEGKTPTELNSDFLTMVDDRTTCRDCWARYLCGGGCLHQAFIDHRSDDPLPAYCTMKRTMVEAAIVKIAELKGKTQK